MLYPIPYDARGVYETIELFVEKVYNFRPGFNLFQETWVNDNQPYAEYFILYQ